MNGIIIIIIIVYFRKNESHIEYKKTRAHIYAQHVREMVQSFGSY